ncbi:ankyrin-3 [Naviculisporaceae sp. PSN 640]
MAPISLYEEAFQKFRKHATERYRDSKEQEVLATFLKERATPEETIDAARSLQSDSQQKYGAKKVGDVKIPGEWVDKIMGNIGNFIEAGNMIVNKGAPESVGMAWFAVRLTLSAIQNNYELYSLFGSGLGDITEIMIIVRHYDRLYDERANSKWKPSPLVEKLFGDVISAYQAVLDFSFAVRRHLTAGTLTRIKHGFKDFIGTSKNKFEGRLATIAELKKKIVEGSQGAFQDKTLTQLEGMSGVLQGIAGTVDYIKEFQSQQEQWHKESTARIDVMMQGIEEIKATTKRKTPWDYALEAFNANRNALKAIDDHGSTETLANTIDSIHPGTCEWIFDDSSYQSWRESTGSEILRIVGQEGTGKSSVLAYIVQRLSSAEKSDIAEEKARWEEELLYISCERTEGSGGRSDYNAKSICYTFLHQLYGLAVEGASGEDARLLEACNDLFKNPKSKEAKRIGKTRVNKEDELPDFAETFAKLSLLLKKSVVLVLDGISSNMSEHDQEELAREFQSLVRNDIITSEHGSTIKVLVGCTSFTPFASKDGKDELPGYAINIEDSVKDDMAKVLEDVLKDTPSLSAAEQEEAKQAILPKAASQFRYLCQVAIPFIREPFVRPLSKRLESLPGGLTDQYAQALRKMKPNYVGLLRTALTWTLLASDEYPLGREVMDAFYGTYDSDPESAQLELDGYRGFPPMARVEIDQLREAAGPFLITDRYANKDGDYYLVPRDRQQVEDFCFKPKQNDEHGPDHVSDSHEGVCSRCKTEIEQTARLSIEPKEGHLRLAITCLRHLNHPTFQRRAGLVNYSSPQLLRRRSNEDDTDSTTGGETDTQVKPNVEEADKPECEQAGKTKGEQAHETAREEAGEKADEKADEQAVEEGGEGDGVVSECDSDESREFEVIRDEMEQAEAFDWSDDDDVRIRYELQYWPSHIRRAEELWTPQEISESEDWKELFNQFEKFARNTEVVRRWHRLHPQYANVIDEASTPLQLTATWGLVSVAQHLIKQGVDLSELSRGRTALQAAAWSADRLEIAKLLLASGADVNYHNEDNMPAMYHWMMKDGSLEAVKTFLDAGADPSIAAASFKATALHFAALYGHDPAVIDLLTDAGADINARDSTDQTPLHYCLWRREVPGDVLSALLRKGANVNAEDKDSARPLHMAAIWGEVNTLKTLLAPGVEEIDDLNSAGNTALYQAATGGHAETVKLLLESGAKPGIKNNLGRVALHEAIFASQKETVQVLLDWEKEHPGTVGVNLPANHNRTPFFFACLSKDDETPNVILEFLLENKLPLSEINQLTKRGRTPLRQAADQGRDSIVSRLIELAAEEDDFSNLFVNQQFAINGMTPLHRAAKGGHLGCVRLLLDRRLGTDITIKDKEGRTALTVAYQEWAFESEKSAYEDIISILIDMDPAAARNDAELIGTVAANGSTRLLKQLWRLKADLNVRDQYGWTPLEIARKFSQKSAEEFLSKQQAWTNMLPTRWGVTFPFATPGAAKSVVKDEVGSLGGTKIAHSTGERICLASDRPLPPGLDEYYFEVTFHDVPNAKQELLMFEHPIVAIGFCTIGGAALKFPGWEPKPNAPRAKSWAFHGDDGGLFCSADADSVAEIPEFKYGLAGDTVGCGVNLRTHELFWTKNGVKIPGASFQNVDGRLFPVVGFSQHEVVCTTNFGGEPFMWKGEGTEEADEDHDGVGTTTVVEVEDVGVAEVDNLAAKLDVLTVSTTPVAVAV